MVERQAVVLDHVYGALANPTRREMLRMLSSGPRRVTDLAAPFKVTLAAASKHIGVLEEAGLVSRSIRGRDHVLSLVPRRLLEARDWIETNRAFWESRLDALEAHFRSR
jgi:DNA-binding transcriptional ArsR family regulator